MSVIGFLIGLGDRHLDNLLLDLQSGEVVHIDYNVCFEKGTLLRVPETVPFRMTPNMQAALGITGVEGTFRLACEEVTGTLRGGRETLLTLLEAFVYDPLVDWTQEGTAAHHDSSLLPPHNLTLAVYGSTRNEVVEGVGRELALKMLQIRQKEHAVAWIANRESVEAALDEYAANIHSLAPLFAEEKRLKELVSGLETERESRVAGLTSASMLPPLSEAELTTAFASSRLALDSAVASLTSALEPRWHPLRSLLATHHKLLAHARPALRALASTKEGEERNRYSRYLTAHKEWMDRIVNGLNPAGDDRPTDATAVTTLVHHAIQLLPQIYGALDGSEELSCGEEDTGRAEEERKEEQSAQGMAIWRRVRAKLDGCHKDTRLSVKEQGWTAWV